MPKYWIAPQEQLSATIQSWSGVINTQKKEDFEALDDKEALKKAREIIQRKFRDARKYPVLIICRADPGDKTLSEAIAYYEDNTITGSRDFVTIDDLERLAKRMGFSEKIDRKVRIIYQG